MKKQLLVSIFSFFVVNSFAQSGNWQWGVAADSVIKNNYVGCASAASDRWGNIFIGGNFTDTMSIGNYNLIGTYADFLLQGNAYLSKYDSNGNVLWAIQSYNASTISCMQIEGVATDKSGNVYTTGCFKDTATIGSNVLISVPQSVYVMKCDKDGNILWIRVSKNGQRGKRISNAMGTSIATDQFNNVYISGWEGDTILFNSTLINSPFFYAKYDSSGNLIWAKPVNASTSFYEASLNAIACDNSGNLFLAGTLSDTVRVGAVTLICAPSQAAEAFVIKLDSGGNALWGQQSISSNTKFGFIGCYAVNTDVFGNVYITGTLCDTATFGTTTLTAPYNNNIFVVKYNSSGNEVWAKSSYNITDFAYNTGFSGRSLIIDSSQNVYLSDCSLYSKLPYFKVIFAQDTVKVSLDSTISYDKKITFFVKYDSLGNIECLDTVVGDGAGNVAGTFLSFGPNEKSIYVAGALYYGSKFGADSLDFGDLFIAKWLSCDNNIATGINQLSINNNQLSVYPNPTSSYFHTNIILPQPTRLQLSLINVLGQTVWSADEGNVSQFNGNISVADLAEGVYLLEMKTGVGMETKEVVVTR